MTMQIKIENCDAPGTSGRKLRVLQYEGAHATDATEVALLGPG